MQACLASASLFTQEIAALPAEDVSTPKSVAVRLEAFCNTSLAEVSPGIGQACRQLSSVVAASRFRGYAGRRAGSICAALGACMPALLTTSCVLTHEHSILAGRLDLCTQEGIENGTALPDVLPTTGASRICS
jgi:hypothetical protein